MAKGEAPKRRVDSVRQRRAVSVRLRLMLPIVIAIAGMLTLGTIQVVQALRADADAGRAQALSDMASISAKLLHRGQDEVAATIASHETDGASFDSEYAARVRDTDKFIEQFRKQADVIRELVPELRATLFTAEGAIDQVKGLDPDKTDGAREYLKAFAKDKDVKLNAPDTDTGLQLYRSIADRILDVADALHRHIDDKDLAAQSRAVAALAGAKQAAGNQRFLVHNALVTAEEKTGRTDGTVKISDEDTAQLALDLGVETQRLGEFYRAAGAVAKGQYAKELIGWPSIQKVERATTNLLNGDEAGISSSEWDGAQNDRFAQLHKVETALSDHLQKSAQALANDSWVSALVTGGAVLALSVLTFIAAMTLAIRISRRLRRLRRDALAVAEDTLPSAVSEMTQARSERQVNDAVTSAELTVKEDNRGPNDEVGAVSQAFSVVHEQALRLAADQAMLRLDVAAMMIALSRRGQSLVQRQLHMLDEFSSVERDPDGIHRLRALNHLASRMRRNEENLLLLAGGDPGRRHNSATPVATVVNEAAAEIEDSARVVVEDAARASIVAGAVGDVVHLLAELLENAALFSPPNTKVRVATRRNVREVVISVNDEGIGLEDAQVAEINARLAEPSGLTSSLAGTMGLLVVARLASRHGIDVQLHSTAGKGTLAVVRLPESLIAAGSGGNDRSDSGRSVFDFSTPSIAAPGAAPVGARPEPLQISNRPAQLPVTGTGDHSALSDTGDIIVPRPRKPTQHIPAAPVSAAPVSATPITPAQMSAPPMQAAWFRPATGSGDFPTLAPGSLKWQAGAGDVAYDQARQAIEAAPKPAPSIDGALPRRSPGAGLLPGSVDVPTPAPAPTSQADADGIDPDEIRTRLSGFAGGIAAASDTSSTTDIRRPSGDS
ncbi:sensor histidine kinase [Stackebrandtia nassauensis]|uniref:histidine kinase n=1 Tax=Stackebrandtia nassauensis (strain DSM 44728 / CIP 108903 / NRRL B-16338 / NBRC 102104 / LLR-40K-21) TaxID=446470 RepID=D3PW61_STANL|nr:nitrate- and nitrite sensing domain-containing protein [Stackebrandtia nassauensis]ADD41218.1 histidine kinase [Stackebrandtia nassauensis DSM 44728]